VTLVTLAGSSATTQAWPVLLVSAIATARAPMVGPVERKSADSSAFTVWVMSTSTAGLLW